MKRVSCARHFYIGTVIIFKLPLRFPCALSSHNVVCRCQSTCFTRLATRKKGGRCGRPETKLKAAATESDFIEAIKILKPIKSGGAVRLRLSRVAFRGVCT